MNKYIHKVIDLYTQYLVGDPAKSEFHSWLTDKESSQEKDAALFQIWENTANVVTEDTLTSLASLQNKHQYRKERKNIHLQIFRYAAAIALLLLASSVFFFANRTAPEPVLIAHYAQSEQVEKLVLPDSSIVSINSGSTLLYPETYGKKTRTVYLTGEANFKVCENKSVPFIVKSKNFSVTALGTEFDVSAYPNDSYFKSTLISGSIEIQQNDQPSSYILKPKEQFVYHEYTKKYTIESVNLYDATAWQRNELAFNGVTLAEILDALEHKYDVSFQYKSETFNNDKYNFHFKKHSSISCILDIIMEASGDLTYKKTGDSYHITKKQKMEKWN